MGALFLLFAPVFRRGHAGLGQELPVQATDGPEARLGADVGDTVLGPGQQVLGLLYPKVRNVLVKGRVEIFLKNMSDVIFAQVQRRGSRFQSDGLGVIGVAVEQQPLDRCT